MRIFLWALIGLGDRLAAKSEPPPPLLCGKSIIFFKTGKALIITQVAVD